MESLGNLANTHFSALQNNTMFDILHSFKWPVDTAKVDWWLVSENPDISGFFVYR